MINKEMLLSAVQKRFYNQFWLSEESFNDLSKEASEVQLGRDVGTLCLLYRRDIIIDISITEELSVSTRKIFAKINKVQKITPDDVRIPSKVLYLLPEKTISYEIL